MENNFEEFPENYNLASFDPSDRKFVAASISSRVDPLIYNATDSDWEEHKSALEDIDIRVIQLCPQHAKR